MLHDILLYKVNMLTLILTLNGHRCTKLINVFTTMTFSAKLSIFC